MDTLTSGTTTVIIIVCVSLGIPLLAILSVCYSRFIRAPRRNKLRLSTSTYATEVTRPSVLETRASLDNQPGEAEIGDEEANLPPPYTGRSNQPPPYIDSLSPPAPPQAVVTR